MTNIQPTAKSEKSERYRMFKTFNNQQNTVPKQVQSKSQDTLYLKGIMKENEEKTILGKYKNYLIAGAIAIVLTTATVIGIKQHKVRKFEEELHRLAEEEANKAYK